MNIADIHRSLGKVEWVYLLAIEGVREMFASHHVIAGSGPESWIGTEHGDRVVLPGLLPPPRLSLGKVDPWDAKIVERAVDFSIVDYDEVLPSIFRARFPDEETDYLGRRLTPLEDPAPAQVLGIGETLVPLHGRHVGHEAFGPAGERRYYWLAPTDKPPGAEHPGLPLQPITPGPTKWAGRRAALYRIVKDPDTGDYPSWSDQYEHGQLWRGSMTDNGNVQVTDAGITWTLQFFGPESWKRKSLNTSRPAKPRRPEAVVELDPGQDQIAVWFEEPESYWLQGKLFVTGFNASVFHPAHSLAGITSQEGLAAWMNDIVKVTAKGVASGEIDPETTSHLLDKEDYFWGDIDNDNGSDRDATVSKSAIKIMMENDGGKTHYNLIIVMHAKAWAALGYDPHTQPNFLPANSVYGASLPVGQSHSWDTPEGANTIPGPGYYRGLFPTFDYFAEDEVSDAEKDNGGQWKYWRPMWGFGTVILDPNPGQILRLGIGEVQCAGQFAQPYSAGSEIDGEPVDSTGWWVFEGVRMDPGDKEARPYHQVALCSWISADSGAAIAVSNAGYASIRIERWENPRLFGFDNTKLDSPWVSTPESLQMKPLGVVGGFVAQAPDYVHHLIGRILLSSGTARWNGATPVKLTPGTNHPPNLVGDQVFAGDLETSDLGCAVPHAYIDLDSIWATTSKLPGGGKVSPLNRARYSTVGTRSLNTLWHEILGGRGWAWNLKPPPGGGPLRHGIFDAVAPLGPSVAEVVITDQDVLGWGRVDVRDGGPFDRFDFSVGRNPLTREHHYEVQMPSQDAGAHLRGGSVPWTVEDGGLRKPTDFPNTGDIHRWESAARERFTGQIARYHAARNFILRLPIKAHKVPELGLGSIVWTQLTGPVPNPKGGYGLNHFGHVVELEHVLTGELAGAAVLTLEMRERGIDDRRIWGPSAWAYGYDTQTGALDISANWSELADHDDTVAFTKPDWCTHADGPLRVAIWQSENGRTYPDKWVVYADVVAADPESHTLTLANLSGGPKIYRDMIKWVTGASFDKQIPGGWAQKVFAYNTRPDGTFGNPPQKGFTL